MFSGHMSIVGRNGTLVIEAAPPVAGIGSCIIMHQADFTAGFIHLWLTAEQRQQLRQALDQCDEMELQAAAVEVAQ